MHPYTEAQPVGGNLAYVWDSLPADTPGAQAAHTATGDRTVQVAGVFDGATVYVEGSLDGVDWFVLRDTMGVALTFAAPGLRAVLENTPYVRPRTQGGAAATAARVTVNIRR